jgi:hypothetical protein
MTPLHSPSPFFVHGVELVGVDSLCECCEQRPAIGRSIKGHAICQRCAGWAAHEADEYAREVEAAKQRRVSTHMKPSGLLNPLVITTRVRRKPSETRPNYICGHPRTNENTYRRRDGRTFCRECRRAQSTRSKEKARAKEHARLGRAS